MNEFKDYNLFLKKSGKKNTISLLKTTYGLGFKSIKKVNLLNGDSTWQFKRVENTSVDLFNKIKTQISFFYSLEKNKIFNNVNKKKRIKNYQGMRHILRLPVHGQRTHTNSKTPRVNIKKEL